MQNPFSLYKKSIKIDFQTYLNYGTNIPPHGYGKLDWIAVILQHNNRIKFK